MVKVLTNVSVGYLGCGTELQLDHTSKIEDVSVLMFIFSILLGFLDCLHPSSIAASRVKSGPRRS